MKDFIWYFGFAHIALYVGLGFAKVWISYYRTLVPEFVPYTSTQKVSDFAIKK